MCVRVSHQIEACVYTGNVGIARERSGGQGGADTFSLAVAISPKAELCGQAGEERVGDQHTLSSLLEKTPGDRARKREESAPTKPLGGRGRHLRRHKPRKSHTNTQKHLERNSSAGTLVPRASINLPDRLDPHAGRKLGPLSLAASKDSARAAGFNQLHHTAGLLHGYS